MSKEHNTPFIDLFKALTQKAIEDNKELEEHEKKRVILLPEIAQQILFEIEEIKTSC